MRVGSRGARRFVFVGGQQFAQLVGGLLPFPRRMRRKDVRHRAPAAVSREHGFFLAGRVAVFGFELFQRADGGDIVEGLFAQAAFADPVRVGYSEIAGRLGWRLVGVRAKDDCGRPWLGGSAHSRVADLPGRLVVHLLDRHQFVQQVPCRLLRFVDRLLQLVVARKCSTICGWCVCQCLRIIWPSRFLSYIGGLL